MVGVRRAEGVSGNSEGEGPEGSITIRSYFGFTLAWADCEWAYATWAGARVAWC